MGRSQGIAKPVVVGLTLGALLIGGVLGGLFFSGSDEVEAEVVASASAPVASASAKPPPPPPKKSTAERATLGDEDAIKALEAKAAQERTGEETIALYLAPLVKKRAALEEIGRKTELLPSFGLTDKNQKKIMGYVKNPHLMVDALRMLASLPNAVGADYLNDIARTRRLKGETRELARQLLHSKEVREHTSDALKILFALEKATDAEEKNCSEMLKLLKVADADADRRSFRTLASLNRRRGCGDTKREDCWECLREGEGKKQLRFAVAASQKTKAPL